MNPKQKRIITGLMMGDGCINHSNDNRFLIVNMIAKEYLNYVDSQLGVLSTAVSMRETASESATRSRKRGFSPNAEECDYSDIYTLQSRSHPELDEFVDWYSSGEKVWPEKIKLTPTTLKHWYCGDGMWNNTQGNNRIEFGVSNERNNTDKVDSYFNKVGLPEPSNYSESVRDDGSINCHMQFTVQDSKKLWKYMGEPLPGFGYKWPDKYK